MCIPNSIQHKIHKRTGNGDMIAIFLVDTMQGQHTDAKFNHRLEAAKHLIKYGFTDTDYEAIAKEIREEEERDDNSKPLRFQTTAPSSHHSSESRNPEDHQSATHPTPLPQGEGWGEGSDNSLPPSRG